MTLESDISTYLVQRDLQGLFLDLLGWDQPGIASLAVELDGTAFIVRPVAQKRGLHVLEVVTEPDVPTADIQHRIDAEIAQSVPERLLVFTGPTRQVWRWPSPRKSGGVRLVAHEINGPTPQLAIIQRLAGVQFALAEEGTVTLPTVKDRVRLQFNAEPVTNRFYRRFEQEHASLRDALEGIEEAAERRWYASVLMNRLMFIYFFQKKRFLNGDVDYLRTCLSGIRGMRGDDEFYGFYRDVLLPMFHQGFGSHLHSYPDPEIAALLGDIPYVNGGIFEEHEIESAYEIRVPDGEFERIFDFFDEFQWHLDDREQGNPNAINPDVIGYIFERYINLTTAGKKEGGAYYTKEDVTGYMAASTVLPRVLERLVDSCAINPVVELHARPRRYVPEPLLHGADPVGGWLPIPSQVETLANDALRWSDLRSVDHDPELQLPDEWWVETLDRRRYVESLMQRIRDGEINTVDDLITYNLDIRTLLADIIHGLDSPASIATAWRAISSMTIIDPTCGSGAFLFAALELLDEIYAALLERARTHIETGNADAADELGELVATADSHPNDGYYRRKHAALSNLYGLDIMREAVETAKLRLFLSLAAKLNDRSEVEPLPDLDFNLRSGNLLVGFFDVEDARGRLGTTSFDALNAIEAFVPRAHEAAELRARFIASQREDDYEATAELKVELTRLLDDVRDEADHAYAAAVGVPTSVADYSAWWLASSPFHWMLEFPAIIEAGGFDVVIGNPPYINRSKIEYSVAGYATSELPDIYAVCVERSLSLLGEHGRFAMILPIAFQFADGHKAVRRELLKQGTVWVSTYSRNPSALFTAGLGVRSTIAISSRSAPAAYSTGQRRWQAEARSSLFATTRYSKLPATAIRDAWLPRTGEQDVAELFGYLTEPSRPALRSSVVRNGHYKVGYKAFATHYVAAYLKVPPTYDRATLEPVDPPADKTLGFDTEEDALLAFGLMAGSLGELWWLSNGDDFNVSGATLMTIPIGLDEIRNPDVLAAAASLRDEAHDPENLLFTPYAGLMTGSWDLRRVRKAADAFDYAVLQSLNLTEYLPAILRAMARFDKSTGERGGTERGTGWLEPRRAALGAGE